MTILKLFQEGGLIMYPLLFCSLAIWAVIFERFWGIGQFNKQYKRLFVEARKLVKENKVEEAKGLFMGADELISAPYLTLFEEMKADKKSRDEKVSRRLSETQQGLRRYLWVLGTVGSSAPFIGLFGTVVGIIKSFESMAISGKGGFSVVAAGLSEALIATAAGILVAVIAVIFYNYFLSRLGSTNLDFKNKLEDFADLLDS